MPCAGSITGTFWQVTSIEPCTYADVKQDGFQTVRFANGDSRLFIPDGTWDDVVFERRTLA